MLAGPVAASPAHRAGGLHVDASGLTAGPFLTSAGLVWDGPRGVMLTHSARRSSVLAAPDAPDWNNSVDLAWFGRGWWALARPSGVFAGRIGGPLRELPQLHKCNPASASRTPGVEAAQYVVSGDNLYAALAKGCLARRSARFGEVLDFDLRSHRSHVLTRMPGTLAYMAASERYVALAYWRSTPHSFGETPLVRVLRTVTGALVSQITPPRTTGANGRGRISSIQVDNRGNVLVTEGSCGAPPGQLAHVAQPLERRGWWWARVGSTVGHDTQLGEDAVLSDGRVAYFSNEACSFAGAPGGTIAVKNLFTDATRTVVAFSGSLGGETLALSGNRLAWAQQSTVLNVTLAPGMESCGYVPLSPVELTTLNLRDSPSPPVLVSGVLIPSQYANEPPCIRV
jgi:hypothetical protein